MVMLGTLAAPSLLGSCTGSEGDKAAGISFAMNYFKVSEGDLRKVLAAALEKGGDYADLFFEHSYRNNVGLQDHPTSILGWAYESWLVTKRDTPT
jgi:TldD protein